MLAILAVEKVAHGVSAGFVNFLCGLAIGGVPGTLSRGSGGFLCAAGRTAIGEAGFVWSELELFGTNGAGSERKCHLATMIQLPRRDSYRLAVLVEGGAGAK